MGKVYTTYRNFRSRVKAKNGFIFDTLGSATACCEVDSDNKSVKVGFSFLSPLDSQLSIRGRGLAKSRLLRHPITIVNVEVNEKGKLKVTEALINYFKSVAEQPKEKFFELLGIEPYTGKPVKWGFLDWFPKFLFTLLLADEREKGV